MRSARLVIAVIALALSRAAAQGAICPSVTWTTVLLAALSAGGSGVAELSPSNVWVVGQNPSTVQPEVEHWNGSTWSVVPTPTLGNGDFRKIAAIGPNDIWAVGAGNFQQLALAEHWDGTAWTVAPTISPGVTFDESTLQCRAVGASCLSVGLCPPGMVCDINPAGSCTGCATP